MARVFLELFMSENTYISVIWMDFVDRPAVFAVSLAPADVTSVGFTPDPGFVAQNAISMVPELLGAQGAVMG